MNLQFVVDHFDERFDVLGEEAREIKTEVGQLRTSVDNLAKMVKDNKDEHTVLYYRVEKLERKVFE